MKKIALWLACACLFSTATRSRADIFPAAAGDSLRIDFNCLDSLGKPIACDSAFFTLYRFPTSGSRALVDSGRTTTFTETALGTAAKATLLQGRDSVYMITTVGNTTVGLYKMNVKAYGGLMGASTKLTVENSRWFIVGAATTTNYAALSDVQRWNTTAPSNLISGRVDASVGAMATDVVTSGAIASGAADEIADSTWGAVRAAPTVSATTFGAALDSLQDIGIPLVRDSVHVVHVETDALNGGTLLTTADNIGINWGDITNPTTAQNLSGTFTHGYLLDTVKAYLSQSQRDSIADRVNDSVWLANFASYETAGASTSIIDSAKGWGQTGAASGVDSAGLSRAIRRMFGLQNAASQADSLTITQRTVNLQQWQGILARGQVDDGSGRRYPPVSVENWAVEGNVASGTVPTSLNASGQVGSRTLTWGSGSSVVNALQSGRVDAYVGFIAPAQMDSLAYMLSGDPKNMIQDPGFEARPLGVGGVWTGIAGTVDIVQNGYKPAGRKCLRLAAASAKAISDTFFLSGGDRLLFGGLVLSSNNAISTVQIETPAGAIQAFVNNAGASGNNLWSGVLGKWRVGSPGFYRMAIINGSVGSDTMRVDNMYLSPLPDSVSLAALSLAVLADSVDNHGMKLTQLERDSLANRVNDSVWQANLAAYSTIGGSFGDSAKRWAYTAAGGGTDTLNIRTMMLGQRFARHRSAPGSNLDTVNAAASLSSLGAGPYNVRIYALDTATGAAVQGYIFSIRDSITGTIWAQTFATNASGYVDFASIGNATYYARGAKTLYRFAANADTTLNVLAANFTDTVLVVGGTVGPPSSGNLVRVSGYEKDNQARGIFGLKVTATLVRPAGVDLIQYPNSDSSNQVNFFSTEGPVLSDTAGCWYIDLLPPSTLSDTTAYYLMHLEGKYRGRKFLKDYDCVRPPNTVNWLIKKTGCVQ